MTEIYPRPSLDHYHGRRVESVHATDGVPSEWSIELEGGILISNKDGRRTLVPSEIVGKVLLTTIFSETETQLRFGLVTEDGQQVQVETVTFTPTQYTLAGFAGQESEFYPQVPEELVDALPPDPSADRFVDGLEDAHNPYAGTETDDE